MGSIKKVFFVCLFLHGSLALSQPSQSMAQKGQAVYRDIVSNTINIPFLKSHLNNYVESIADLIHFFYEKAKEKGQAFSSGTFVIYDPGFKVYNFLSDYVAAKWAPNDMFKEVVVDIKGKGAYPRKSTHFNSYYLYTNKAKKNLIGSISKQKDFIHYGIDIPKQIALPALKHHVLFGKVEIQPPLTFIKIEDHGLGKIDVIKHTIGLGKAQMRKAAGKVISKLKKSGVIANESALDKWLSEFSESMSDDSSNARRERIPVDTLATFLGIVLAKSSPLQKSDLETKKIKAFGIQHMLELADRYAKGNQGTPAWRDALAAFARDIRNQYDHTELRMGREVILKPGIELPASS